MKSKVSIAQMKSKVQPLQISKRLRSRLPRRRRSQISPIRYSCSKTCPVVLPIDLSASSHLSRDISCDSSRVSVNKPRPPLKKRGFEEINGFGENEVFRRVTRSYYRQRENEMMERKEEKKRGLDDGELEVSESSCVESCSGVDVRERSSILNSKSGNGAGNVNEFEGVEDPEAIAESEVSCVQKFSGEFSGEILKSGGEKANRTENSHKIKENEVLLSDKMTKDGENGGSRDELLEVSRNSAEANFAVSNSESTMNSKPRFNANDSDLACTEHLSYEDVSDYSSAFSDLQSELFQESSERDFSDYSPSIWLESGSEFSERSVGDKSPTPTFSQFHQYGQQFCRSTFPSDSKFSARFEEDNRTDELASLKLEDDEHENSYRMFINRERRQVYLRDYAEEYCCTTDYGELVIQQRLEMVHWIVEQSTTKELQKETMFLGVSLMDRFLSKGFFKNKRNLQVVGIACLTLATRIVENQPLNSVRQKTFYVGNNIYNRYEVVAMEWLVQEVLNFQCFLPTIYSFLWFYLKAARANEEVEKTAKYLAVLALLGHEQLCYWPSTVAAGLVVLSSLASNQDAYCGCVMETHLRTKGDDLPGCIKSLEWLVKYVC